MRMDLRDRIRAATEASGISKPDFVELLKLIDQHYDKMEATISESLQTQSLRTQALQTQTHTPIEAIFDSVTQALLSVGTDGIVRNCNRVCSHYFNQTKDQLIGSNIADILPGAKNQSIGDFLSPYMTNLDDTQIELVAGEVDALRADGERFVAEVTASTLETVGGDIFVVSLRDVTDRKEAEGALRENEERYRALVENAPEAIVVFDVDNNRFTDANDNACVLFNLSRTRLLTIGPDAISPKTQPDGKPSFGVHRGLVDSALAGEHPTFEWMHSDSTGKPLPCEVRFSRLPSDDQRLIRVSIIDITERKRNEAFSYAQNKVLEMIAASMPHDRTLRAICRFAENICGDLKVAIMQLDIKSQTLSVEQAPSLQESFKLCLDFVPVDLENLTCGAAVCERKDRITTDIAKDDGWKPVRDTALQHGIKATWSFVLYGAAGRVIGTLDAYLGETRSPTTDELDKLGRMARLAGIAIKRHQDEEKLRTS